MGGWHEASQEQTARSMESSHDSGLPPGPKVREGQRKSQRTGEDTESSKNRFSPSKVRSTVSGSAVSDTWKAKRR